MNAKTQYRLAAADLEVVLALQRAGNLAAAGERLGVDASTVFRAVQRLERGLGQPLFVRSRTGYQGLELARQLAAHAEQLEVVLEAARAEALLGSDQVSGLVCLSTTDTLLHGLLAPLLVDLGSQHPGLAFELETGNALANLSRRDVDIALRATRRPPQHLIGRRLGAIRVALYAAKASSIQSTEHALAGQEPWVSPDRALPDHPSVLWRKKHFPKIQPTYQVDSILSVAELVAQGLGVGVLPQFLADKRSDLRAIGNPIDEAETELWLLAHPESRHLRRVSTVYTWLAERLKLD
ncbi:LysR family transcriptional regulator [Parachitinimonas caeni]|uniref:LysR family transcriptional regulator n=1 Tax=Parachitinimonas caeni TaxID=3031301 RepID=A0ABT7DXV5_9NEIS|nr:LysR family transcriptional regulator [Parachitinimonas caeni]MDK2124829.1 LysR family transcriptional regulator [Parachitinimonas caeni]